MRENRPAPADAVPSIPNPATPPPTKQTNSPNGNARESAQPDLRDRSNESPSTASARENGGRVECRNPNRSALSPVPACADIQARAKTRASGGPCDGNKAP